MNGSRTAEPILIYAMCQEAQRQEIGAPPSGEIEAVMSGSKGPAG